MMVPTPCTGSPLELGILEQAALLPVPKLGSPVHRPAPGLPKLPERSSTQLMHAVL